MEQLRSFLDAVRKYHFWILCGLACLVGLVMYYVSSNGLIKNYEKQKGTISTVAGGINSATSGGQLPNENWVAAGRKRTDEYRIRIYDAWKKLYDQQKKTVYIWPDSLGPGFVKAFSNDSPKNVIPKDDLDEYRQYYQNYVVASALPALAASVNAEWVAVREEGENKAGAQRFNPRGDRSRPVGPGRPGIQKVESASSVNHPCVWEATDQQRWVETFTWDPDPPTEVEIRFAQEDQWVLKALFDSIARANSGAQVSTDAVVRVIQEALVGIDANSQTPLGEGSFRIVHMRPAATPAPGPGGAAGQPDASAPPVPAFVPRQGRGGGRGNRGQQPGPRGGGRGGRLAGPGAAGPAIPPGGFGQAEGQPGASADPSEALKNFRYCDAKGKPLPASELANTNSPEYLLMPFRLVLVCDEARFPVIVAELANSPMPLEVREVRINAESEEKAQGRRDRGRQVAVNSGNQGEAGILHNATVEIWGMAYLISRPEPKKLGLTEAAAPAPAAGDATVKPGDATAKPAADGPTPATGTIEPGKAPGSTTTTDATQTPPANGAATSGTADKGTAKEAAAPDSAAPPATAPPTTTPDKAAPATEPPATK